MRGSLAPPIISFIALILVIFPLRWHWRTKNIATLTLAFSLAQANLFAGISTIAWRDNVEKKLITFCNIGVSLQRASIFALVAAAMCTVRNLEGLSSPRMANNGTQDIRRRKRFDFLWCGIFPFIFSAMQYIVTPNQFDIVEGVGCQPTLYVSWPAIFIWYTPQIILGTTTLTYAILTFQWLLIHRGRLREDSAISMMQFLRLLALALILASYGLGFSIYQLRVNVGQLQAWISWDNVHSGFSQIGQVPAKLIPEDIKQIMWTFWSIYPSAAFLFFILFGLNSEAMRDWEYMVNWAKTKFRRLVPFKHGPPPVPANDDTYWYPMSTYSGPVAPAVGARSVSKHKKTAADRWAAGDDLDFVDSDTDDDDKISHETSRGIVRSRLVVLDDRSTVERQ